MFPADSACFSYYDPKNPSTVRTALHQLDSYIAAEGPFDALMGFSQGAVLAAMHVIRESDNSTSLSTLPRFQCAVFIAGADPTSFDEIVVDGVEKFYSRADSHAKHITIPVAHIWGRNDCDGADQSRQLSKLCDTHYDNTFVHDGGHEVPGTGPGVMGSVRVIRRAIDQALFSQ
ncbi:MAG: hypothetical protein Q9157_001236 [Trypethelium eluteriae]